MFKAIFIVIIISAMLILSTLWHHSSSQLNYSARNMEWSWSWMYYDPFSNGIQTARTNDTKQLIFRRVDESNNMAIYVDVTYTNTFEVIVINEQICQPKSTMPITIQLNNLPPEIAHFVCEDNGQAYLFRQITKKLSRLKIEAKNVTLSEDFANWPIEKLKKDQFVQQHSSFFKGKGEEDVYEWSRD